VDIVQRSTRGNQDSRLDLDRRETSNHSTGAGMAIRLRTPVRDYGTITVGLVGEHQRDNALVAVRTLETLAATVPISEPAIRRGLSNARWPGRLDLRRLPDGRELLLDAAHNPDGAEMLARYLRHAPARLPLVFGAMRDKDHAAMLARLGPAVASIVFTRAAIARAADPDDLAATARGVGLAVPFSVEPSPLAAAARAWTDSRRIVVAGSIALLGDVLEGLGLV
jgi:dihydrofolate synthase/folylpolyglutamate synthase